MDKKEQQKLISDDLDCILAKMDVPKHLVGYKYLHFAIMQAVINPIHFRKQNDGFKFVTEQLEISVSAFKDGVKRATTYFWESNNVDKMVGFFRNCFSMKCGVPSDFELITYMASYLRTKHDYV